MLDHPNKTMIDNFITIKFWDNPLYLNLLWSPHFQMSTQRGNGFRLTIQSIIQ